MDTDQRLTMSLVEFARLAGLGRNLVYREASAGRLPVPVLRIGRRRLLPRKAALDFLEGIDRHGRRDAGPR